MAIVQVLLLNFNLGDPFVSSVNNMLVHSVEGEEVLFFSYNTTSNTGIHSVIAKWDGNEVTPIGYIQGGRIGAIEIFDGQLHIGGNFSEVFDSLPDAAAGGVPAVQANNVARWDGEAWSPLGEGTIIRVFEFAVFDDGTGEALYAGGQFVSDDYLPVLLTNRWDGNSWSTLNDTGPHHVKGTSLFVTAMEVFDDGAGEGLYVAGPFTSILVKSDDDPVQAGIDEVSVNRIAAWRCLDDVNDD